MTARGASGPPEIAVASLYKANLVTRHTGRAVRLSIEGMIAELNEHSLTVLDFRDVSVLDFSCADEIVAKLMLRTVTPRSDGGRNFFLFRGIDEHHRDQVDCALRRRSLAAPAETRGGQPMLMGDVEPDTVRAWEAVCHEGRACVGTLAGRLGMDESACGRLLETMCTRRLIRRDGDDYLSLFQSFAEAEGGTRKASGVSSPRSNGDPATEQGP